MSELAAAILLEQTHIQALQ